MSLLSQSRPREAKPTDPPITIELVAQVKASAGSNAQWFVVEARITSCVRPVYQDDNWFATARNSVRPEPKCIGYRRYWACDSMTMRRGGVDVTDIAATNYLRASLSLIERNGNDIYDSRFGADDESQTSARRHLQNAGVVVESVEIAAIRNAA